MTLTYGKHRLNIIKSVENSYIPIFGQSNSYFFKKEVPIFTARKRSLGQGNIFTPVCHSVHRGRRCYPSMHCRWYPVYPSAILRNCSEFSV